MPEYSKPRIMEWLEQEPSVMESPLKKAARKVYEWLGPGSPEDLINPMEMGSKALGALAGFGIDEYKRRGLLPKSGTRELREGLHGLGMYGPPTEGANIQNVLDLVDPNPADIHKAIRSMPEDYQRQHMDYFNDALSKGKTSNEAYGDLSKLITMPEGSLEKAKFDAVRFPGQGDEWMVPSNVQLGDSRLNASGESAASLEAQSRLSGMKNRGEKYALRGPGGVIKPIAETVDAVDIVAPKGWEKIIQYDRPQVGDVLPSGRRFVQKTEAKESTPKRMSLAELMAMPSKKESSSKLNKDDIKRLLNK